MAKQLVSPVERHIEKVVLAAAVLVLLGAVAIYLVSSPNTVEIDGARVTPQTVDNFVLSKAERIRQRIRDAQDDLDRPEPLLEKFSQSVAPLEPGKVLPGVAPVGIAAPFVDEAGATAGQYPLVEVLQLPKPTIASGRSTYIIEQVNAMPRYVPANWLTGSVLIDVRAQSKLQRHAYGATRTQLLYGPIDVDRRTLRADGTWSDDDWDRLEPWLQDSSAWQPPEVNLVTTEGQTEVDPDAARRLDEFYEQVTNADVQLEFLRPLPPLIENGDEWKFPILTTCRDVLVQDDEILFPTQPPAPDPEDRYGLCGVGAGAQLEVDAARRTARKFADGETLLQQAHKTNNSEDAVRAYNVYAQIVKDPETSPADRQKAKRLQGEAEQAENDIIRRKRFGGGRAIVPHAEEDGAARREMLANQQVWFNDTGVGSVRGGMTYQYRMRLTLVNRLVGDPGKFRNPADAAVVYVRGPWSDPSDPVVVPNDVEYYLATEDSRDTRVGVKIHRWFDGVWVESKKIQVSVGDPVQGKTRTPVPSLNDPTKVDRAEVDFDTGAVVLDIDFERRLRERKKGQGRNGLRFGDRVKGVCCVALVGPDGDVIERFLPTDKDNPSQRAAQARTWTPPK